MIDVHTHIFPDPASGEAWQRVAGFEPQRPGTVDDLVARMAEAGIDRAVVLLFPRSRHRAQALRDAVAAAGEPVDGVAIRARVANELRALNTWGCGLARTDPRFVAFVGADASVLDGDELEAEIRRCAAAGARGVKLLPAAMQLYPDDPLLEPVHATCAELGLPILSQSGAGGTAPAGDRGHYGRPAAWDDVLRRHPGLRVVLAHLGHGYEDELIELARRHEGVLSDTSLRLGSPRDAGPWQPGPVRELIDRLGSERVLFGTNYPIVDPVEYARRLEVLDLSSAERDRIASGNAAALLG